MLLFSKTVSDLRWFPVAALPRLQTRWLRGDSVNPGQRRRSAAAASQRPGLPLTVLLPPAGWRRSCHHGNHRRSCCRQMRRSLSEEQMRLLMNSTVKKTQTGFSLNKGSFPFFLVIFYYLQSEDRTRSGCCVYSCKVCSCLPLSLGYHSNQTHIFKKK